jgi:uridine phosphorylase
VFTAAGLLREARRQKQMPDEPVPAACLLDPDGDIADHLLVTGQADWSTSWACYHSRMLITTIAGRHVGVVPRAVGGSYAVLVAEQLFASGCQLLLSVTSAGQLAALATPPYFVLITRAIRDEGTSYHYLPPDDEARLGVDLERALAELAPSGVRVRTGASWTTDAPFRETQHAIDGHTRDGVAAVEMEAASLYAFAAATRRKVVCFAHVTNQMASIDHDFEKGAHNGAADALTIITATLDLLDRQHQ